MAYSLEFQPGFDEPVKVPPDVQAFLDKNRNDSVSGNLSMCMSHYSDRYLNSGMRKGEVERWLGMYIGSCTSLDFVVTDFQAAGDRAYLAGFVIFNGTRNFLRMTSIIKENGEWKWYGNQRDVAR